MFKYYLNIGDETAISLGPINSISPSSIVRSSSGMSDIDFSCFLSGADSTSMPATFQLTSRFALRKTE